MLIVAIIIISCESIYLSFAIKTLYNSFFNPFTPYEYVSKVNYGQWTYCQYLCYLKKKKSH